MDLSNYKAIKDKQAQEEKERILATKQEIAQLNNQELIVSVARSIVDFISGHTTKTQVLNQIEDYATTEDAKQLNTSIESLHETLKLHKNTDVTPVVDELRKLIDEVEKIPKEHPEVAEQKFIDYTNQITDLTKAVEAVQEAIKDQVTTVKAPDVYVEPTPVQVDAPDMKPLREAFKQAISLIKIPEYEATEIEPIVTEQKKQTKLLKEIRDAPRGGGGGGGGSTWTSVNRDGTPVPTTIERDGGLATSSPALAVNIDDTTTANTVYIGKAEIASSSASAVWQISKLDTGSGLSKTWAEGNAEFAHVWDDRATTINYS